MHPADESRRSKLTHVYIPATLGLLAFCSSLVGDYYDPSGHWVQRSGSLLVLVGSYITYHEAKRHFRFLDGKLFINFDIPYRILGIIYLVVGTVVWGYGDLLVKWASL